MSNALLAGLHVLVLEDEYLIAMDVEQLCRDHGAAEVTIMRALDDVPPEAEFPFGFVILDVMLSGTATIEFARTLVQRGVPFVFATGYSDREGFFEPFPAIPVVAKPYAPLAMMEAIARSFAASRAAQ